MVLAHVGRLAGLPVPFIGVVSRVAVFIVHIHDELETSHDGR